MRLDRRMPDWVRFFCRHRETFRVSYGRRWWVGCDRCGTVWMEHREEEARDGE